MGTKNNPGDFDYYEYAEDDEPMFVLRARDPMAPQLVRLWATAREQSAKAEKHVIKAGEAYECADKMDRWKSDNPEH